MWSYRHLAHIDLRVVLIVALLFAAGLLAISSYSAINPLDGAEEPFFTPAVKRQLEAMLLGVGAFTFFAGFNYHKLREWTWFLYAAMLLGLIGLFFADPIQRVQRWYRLPFIGLNFQPSEYAKLAVVIALSWFLERRQGEAQSVPTAFFAGLIVGIPFILILKQPDLGTALVLFPIALVMFYFGHIHPWVTQSMSVLGCLMLIGTALIFLGVIDHEAIRPYATQVIKNYQYDRLDPTTPHTKAAATAIAIGGIVGKGWRQSEYTAGGWLPTAYTDSVFPAFAEEFGFIGLLVMLALFYMLIYFSFQVTAVATDPFGRLLAAGIAIYLAMPVLVNVGMMCGLLPITGVPLILVSYGGSSILSTMTALGILQSIYSRRFRF